MASTNNNDFYKVSFITTKTATIPSMLSNTGGLIVMSDETKTDPATGKNAMSIWLHGNCIASGFGFAYTGSLNDAQWWVNSYNKIFGGNSGLTANDFLEKDPNDPNYIKDSAAYIEGKEAPISIASRISYATTEANNYTNKKFDEVKGNIQQIEGEISATNDANNKKFDDLSSQINDVSTYAHTGVAYSVNYTDYWINRILGGATDFIDSLSEIKNYLDNDKENAMQTLGKLTELTNNTITHEQPFDRYAEPTQNNEVIKDGKTQYTYMSEVSYKEYIDESDESTKRTGEMTYWSYKDENGNDRPEPVQTTYEYNYYVPKREAVGMNAVTDKQICCTDFNQHTLKQILKCIVNPYPYAIPTVTIDSVDDKPAKEWSETITEYGTDLFTNSVNAFIDLKDASNVTSIKFDSDNDAKQLPAFTISSNVDYSDQIKNKKPYPVFNSKSAYTDFISNPYITLLTSYTINYGNAINKVYPQLQSLNDDNLLDTEHAFKAGTVTSNLAIPLKKKIGIKTFYGTQTIPDNDVSLSTANYVWSESNGAFEMHISIDIENTNLIWFAVPDNLFDGTSSIILKSDDSNIITNFGSISSSILSKSVNAGQINHNGIVYKILTIENSEFPFADSSLTASIKW